MDQPLSGDEDARDLLRRIAGWLADVNEANPHAVLHDGPCGARFECPRHGGDGYHRAEILRNGDLLLHCEGKRIRRSDFGYVDRVAELVVHSGIDEERRREFLP